MEDNRFKAKCPNCKSDLLIGDKPGINDKMLSCPQCKYRAKVSEFRMAALSGYNSNDPKGDAEPTQVNFGQMDNTVGSLYLGEKEYGLHIGSTSFGRLGVGCQAEVKIDNGDRFMSRNHARIIIKQTESGLRHMIEPTNPKNPIVINGNKIENSSIMVLNFGDRLRFGHTELLFERPGLYQEGTMIDC